MKCAAATALLAVLALAACEFVKPGEVAQVTVDGVTVDVYPDLSRPNSWGAVPTAGQGERMKLFNVAQTAKNIRAIEAVSGCKVTPGTAQTSGPTTMAHVTC